MSMKMMIKCIVVLKWLSLSRPDDFLMNLLIQAHSRIALDTSRNVFGTNQGTNEDDSQNDPHPEACILHNQTTRSSGPEDGQDSSQAGSFQFFGQQNTNKIWVK